MRETKDNISSVAFYIADLWGCEKLRERGMTTELIWETCLDLAEKFVDSEHNDYGESLSISIEKYCKSLDIRKLFFEECVQLVKPMVLAYDLETDMLIKQFEAKEGALYGKGNHIYLGGWYHIEKTHISHEGNLTLEMIKL